MATRWETPYPECSLHRTPQPPPPPPSHGRGDLPALPRVGGRPQGAHGPVRVLVESLHPPIVVVWVRRRLVVLDGGSAAVGGQRAGRRRRQLYPPPLGVFDPVPRHTGAVHFAPVLGGLVAWDQGCDLGQVTTGAAPSLGDRRVAGGGLVVGGRSGEWSRWGVAVDTLRLWLLLQLLQLLMFWLLRSVSVGRPVDQRLDLMADRLLLQRLVGNPSAWLVFADVYARCQDVNLLHNLEKTNTKRSSTVFFGLRWS